MDINKAKNRINLWFPDLAAAGYDLTSDEDLKYNCIAWAAGETYRRWDDPSAGYYWPIGVIFDERIDSLVLAFESIGYVRCERIDSQSTAVENGVSKIVLYADGDRWTHAARQLPNGKWTSKLGDFEDIEHDKLEGFKSGFG